MVWVSTKGLELDAVLKDGRTLRFKVLTMSMHLHETMGPIERLIVVNGAEPGRIVRDILSWLEMAYA